MHRKGEKVVKTHAQWRRQGQVRKIKIMMTVLLVTICFSAAAAVLLAWSQIKGLSGPGGGAGASSHTSSAESGGLPVYDNSFNLLLVNYAKPLTSDYRPELEEHRGVRVDGRIVPALSRLMEKAKDAGCPLTLAGGYVDAETQDRLYQTEVARLISRQGLSRVRAENQAQNTVGKGGYNENQTGLAVTFSADGGKADFSLTKQYHWLSENSVYYGFVLRFPANSESVTGMNFHPSHFRYVGTENAMKMREFSMCLEEYAAYLDRQSGR